MSSVVENAVAGFLDFRFLDLEDFDFDFLGGSWLRFFLSDFNSRCCRAVSRYAASVSAQVNMVLLTEVVLVEQSSAERRNSHKKLSANSFLNW